MTPSTFTIRRTAESDWREIRGLRLEMIRDTPDAYAETLDRALSCDEAEWRMRGRRGTAEHGICLAALDGSGRWVGTMAGYVPDEESGALLVGVYVAPDFRGVRVGLTDALMAGIEDWARTESSTLTLHVHEKNIRAQRAYERLGFVATGETVPYNLDPTAAELVMIKRL